MSCLEVDTDKVYVGDIGTAIILDTEEDLAGATSLSIEALKPGLVPSTVVWPAVQFETTKVRYVVIAGDIDTAGEWRLQSKVVMPSGTWYGETVRMMVYKRWR